MMNVTRFTSRRKWLDLSLILMVFATGVYCAAILFDRFLNRSRLLWSDVIHDRNAHLLSGLQLATHLQQGAGSKILGDLDSFRTWPPLHDGFAVGLSLICGRHEERWAVLPSLFGWIGSAVFAYLLVRKAAFGKGQIGGLIAALLVLVSPAQRAYATDVMLESLGACLTLACLYAYIVARQSDAEHAYRPLAIALTLLFLEKYNYWTLVVIGLVIDRISAESGRVWLSQSLSRMTEAFRNGGARTWLIRQGRRPLNYLLAGLMALIALIVLTPWNQTILFGHRILLSPPANLVTLAYVVLWLRLAPWYRQTGRRWIGQSGNGARALFTWHLLPVAAWFLWPQHLYSFLWVNSPVANPGEFPQHNLLGGYSYYASCLANDYHLGVWSLALSVGLFLTGAGFALCGRLRPGGTAVFWLVAIALLLTAHHPNRKSRFVHTWIPVLWAGAGIGAASLMAQRRKGLLMACCWGGTGVILWAHWPGLTANAHAPEGGVGSVQFSALDLSDAYLPDLADSRRVAIFSNVPVKQFTQWTYLKRYPDRPRLETDVKGFDPQAADNHGCFEVWLRGTACDTIVTLDFVPGTFFYRSVPGCANYTQYVQMLQHQTRFVAVTRRVLTREGCLATVWKKARTVALPSP
jgi:hypothetical protein